MAKKPTVLATCDDNGFPLAAKCSLCDEDIPLGEPRVTDKDEAIKRMMSEFSIHKDRKHSREDVNQAAARIIREATENS